MIVSKARSSFVDDLLLAIMAEVAPRDLVIVSGDQSTYKYQTTAFMRRNGTQ